MAHRRRPAAALGGWSAAHRKTAVFGWLFFVILATVIGGAVGQKQLTDAQQGVGDSARAVQILQDAGISDPASEMVLVHSTTQTADAATYREAVDQVLAAVRGTGQTDNLQSPYATGLISKDRHYALVEFDMTGDASSADGRVQPVLDAVAKVQAANPGLRISEVGDASGSHWVNETLGTDFKRAEWTAVPLAFGILLAAFGALIAAVLPVLLAVTAFMAALGLLDLISHAVPQSSSSNSVMLLMGLAVGVDYCLFYLRRERQERAAGRDPKDALSVAAATSGHSVLVSGLTVMVAMAGMFITGMHIFEGFALASILVVAIAMVGSVTVLPALLAMLGDRIDWGRRKSRRHRPANPDGGRVWNATMGKVLDHPKGFATAAAAFLILLALPALGLRTASLDVNQQLPAASPLVQTYDAISAEFPASPAPGMIVLQTPDVKSSAVVEGIAAFKSEAAADGALGSGPVQVTSYPAQHVVKILFPVAGQGRDARAIASLNTLRGTVVPHTLGAIPHTTALVGGSLAFSTDFNGRLDATILPVFLFVLGVTFLVMLLAFRSWVIAATAIVLNLLSTGAAYGVMVAMFQHGWGSGLIGTKPVGALESWIPLFVFVVLFGLSMDYHVFVVSRIREAHDRGLSTKDAVAQGLRATAGTITSAAAIMVAVFAVFGTLSMQDFKQLGVGLGAAILLDATVIRVLLLPTVMTLLGERNWRRPRRGRDEPALDLEGAARGADQAGIPA
ncbi:MMPL family transporter [Actinospica sp. MGRD01-02]|uniref:MMPL family transporter n=1 Tax=Actinospica acidithermotolerans TaxID=2828514 RepID=A0A941ECV9_9ACTN|nr:MMPL family transporter [Actinospica acidithermotolerans]MBR7829186.1 MMPL family transporter [Actinospica acidithermotolerans]